MPYVAVYPALKQVDNISWSYLTCTWNKAYNRGNIHATPTTHISYQKHIYKLWVPSDRALPVPTFIWACSCHSIPHLHADQCHSLLIFYMLSLHIHPFLFHVHVTDHIYFISPTCVQHFLCELTSCPHLGGELLVGPTFLILIWIAFQAHVIQKFIIFPPIQQFFFPFSCPYKIRGVFRFPSHDFSICLRQACCAILSIGNCSVLRTSNGHVTALTSHDATHTFLRQNKECRPVEPSRSIRIMFFHDFSWFYYN